MLCCAVLRHALFHEGRHAAADPPGFAGAQAAAKFPRRVVPAGLFKQIPSDFSAQHSRMSRVPLLDLAHVAAQHDRRAVHTTGKIPSSGLLEDFATEGHSLPGRPQN